MICSFLFGDGYKSYNCFLWDIVLQGWLCSCVYFQQHIKWLQKYYSNTISEIIIEAAVCLWEPLDLPPTLRFYSSLWSWRWHYTIGYSIYDMIWYVACLTTLPTHSVCHSGTLHPIAQLHIVCVLGEYSSWCSQKPFSQARVIQVTLWR